MHDPVVLLRAAVEAEPGLYQCDEEQTVDLAGFGKAACIVPDEYLRVGVSSNILQVVIYADEDHKAEFLAGRDLPVHEGDGFLVTAPSQELLDVVVPAIESAAG